MPAKIVKRAPVSKATLQVKAAIKEIESKASKEIQEHLKQLNIVSASFISVDFLLGRFSRIFCSQFDVTFIVSLTAFMVTEMHFTRQVIA